jgi:murein DD-endopeptidase MepM/ murein hydrolase activator NlpD
LQSFLELKRLTGILSISCVLFCLSAAGRVPGDDKKGKTTPKREDTTCYPLADQLNSEEDIPDTMQILFPSHDLYNSWDVNSAHPYNFSESFKEDSVVISLVGPADNGFVLPYQGALTSLFGWRRYRPHFGTDIRLKTGDTVMAAFDGMVRIAKFYHGYGNCVIIRHNNGLETVYAHLSKIKVESGDRVTAGSVIGLGGNTGHSFGSHLHFEIRYLGQALDTQDFIDYETGLLKCDQFVLRRSDVQEKYDLRALHYRHRHDMGLIRQKKGGRGKMVYQVRRGDCLAKIAKRKGITVAELCKRNKLKKNAKLRVGQRLVY